MFACMPTGEQPTIMFLHLGKTAGWTLSRVLERNLSPAIRIGNPPNSPHGFLSREPIRTFASWPEAKRASFRLGAEAAFGWANLLVGRADGEEKEAGGEGPPRLDDRSHQGAEPARRGSLRDRLRAVRRARRRRSGVRRRARAFPPPQHALPAV